MSLKQPWVLSLAFHLSFVVLALAVQYRPRVHVVRQNIEILEYPKVAPPNLNLAPQPVAKPPPPPPEKKAVFGLTKNSITVNGPATENSVDLKAGNTVAKAPDNENLDPNDDGKLPIPEDEYLLSSMPSLVSEVHIPYPAQARSENIEGPVVMDLLIDAQGRVRKAELISGPGHGLNEAALAAIEGFQFRPGQIGEKTVAVKIRYTYRFVLENR